jgi:transposase
MMGFKDRSFAPLPTDLSLEELVPRDNFYRRLEAELDLSFVRDLVRPLYASGGRPSVDPVVFFKLQLVMFFEDLSSERQLMRVVADRLSVRWYVGYDLQEPLPDHSSLTRIRERFGLSVFRRFFERIVEECIDAGLVWGEELERLGKKTLLLIWDNASWHISREVRRWLGKHNREVKESGCGVRIVSCLLPKQSPWLNSIEPKWVHGKRKVVEFDGLLGAYELADRVCGAFGCPHHEHLTIPQEVA